MSQELQSLEINSTIEFNWNPSLSLQDAVKLSNQLFQEKKLK